MAGCNEPQEAELQNSCSLSLSFLIYLFGCATSYLPHVGFFSCGTLDLVPWPGIEPWLLALGAWSLSHWTTRDVPWVQVLNPYPVLLLPFFRLLQFIGQLRTLHVCSVVSDSLRPHGLYLPVSSVHGISPGKNPGVGCHFLLQGIFLTQGRNPCLLCLVYWSLDSLPLSLLGSPEWSPSLTVAHHAPDQEPSRPASPGWGLGWGPGYFLLSLVTSACQRQEEFDPTSTCLPRNLGHITWPLPISCSSAHSTNFMLRSRGLENRLLWELLGPWVGKLFLQRARW